MIDFLRTLYASAPSEKWISVWSLRKHQSATNWFQVSDIASVKPQAEWLNAEGFNVYFGIGLREARLGKGRGKITDVVGIPGLWADIDMCLPGSSHKETALPGLEDQDKVFEILDSLGIEPSVLVGTGGGYHAYWLFDQFWTLGSPQDRAEASGLQKALSDFFAARWRERGWAWDENVNDLARVLRLPGTHNRKPDSPVLPVRVEFLDGPRTSRAALEARLGVVKAATPAPPAPPALTTPGLFAPKPQLQGKVISTAEAWRWIGNLKNPQSKAYGKLVYEGQPFAAPGERDRTLRDLVAIFTGATQGGLPSDRFVEMFRPSLEAAAKLHNDPSNPAMTEDDVRAKYLYFLAKLGWKDPEESAVPKPSDPGELETNRVESYTDDEIKAFAENQGCDANEFFRRWVIQIGTSYFVFYKGDYIRPAFVKAAIDTAFKQYLPVEGLTWGSDKINKDGTITWKPKSMIQMVNDYGTVGSTVVADLRIQHSHYDPATRTFHEATAPLRELEPTFDPEIDRWIDVLAGTKAEWLKDWIATVTQLDQPSAGVYFYGDGGTGKTLIATGLARLWKAKVPTQILDVSDGFNYEMVNCPLLLGDEHIKRPHNGASLTSELRKWLTQTVRSINEKYKNQYTCFGAIRLILTANNEHLLTSREELNSSDVKAIYDRFKPIKVGKDAADYLKSLAIGNKIHREWVEGDGIAKYALWLKANRAVQDDGRFLKEGEESDDIELSLDPVPLRINELLCRAIVMPMPSQNPNIAEGMKVGGGQLLVLADFIHDAWDLYMKEKKPPYMNTHRIGKALKRIRLTEIRKDNRRYHLIDLKHLTPEKFGFYADDLEKAINKPILTLVPLISQPMPTAEVESEEAKS